MPNFIFEHTFFLHHSPFLVLFITLHHRINLWSETNDSRSFPRVTSDGWRVASSGWPVAGNDYTTSLLGSRLFKMSRNDPPKENRCAYHLLEIMVRKWNDIYHSIWNISEIIGYRFNQCIHSFLSFYTSTFCDISVLRLDRLQHWHPERRRWRRLLCVLTVEITFSSPQRLNS